MKTTLLLLLTLLLTRSAADQLRFASPADWASWTAPHGLVQVGDDGRLQLVKFRRDVNVVEDAHLYSYQSPERGEVSGGVWEAGSNAATAP